MSYTVTLVLDPLPTAVEARDLGAVDSFVFDPKEGEGMLHVTVDPVRNWPSRTRSQWLDGPARTSGASSRCIKVNRSRCRNPNEKLLRHQQSCRRDAGRGRHRRVRIADLRRRSRPIPRHPPRRPNLRRPASVNSM